LWIFEVVYFCLAWLSARTYHDIQSLGIDRMRSIYAAAGLAIRKKTQVSKLDTIKEMMRALGENPEQYLSREALSMGNVTTIGDIENHQLSVLSLQLRDILRKATEA
jgi:hypothetical protein